MMRKALYEELHVDIDRQDLAQLLGADNGFEVQNIQEEGKIVRFILGRKTDLNEETAPPERTEQKRREKLF